MMQLVADRFLQLDSGEVLDCSTGSPVTIAIDRSGSRSDQQQWVEACAARLADPAERLIDFGFLGADKRFEVSSHRPRAAMRVSDESASVVEWLEHCGASSSCILRVADSCRFDVLARDLRLQGFIPIDLTLFAADVPGLAGAISGRSIIILQNGCATVPLSLAFQRAWSWSARNIWAI